VKEIFSDVCSKMTPVFAMIWNFAVLSVFAVSVLPSNRIERKRRIPQLFDHDPALSPEELMKLNPLVGPFLRNNGYMEEPDDPAKTLPAAAPEKP